MTHPPVLQLDHVVADRPSGRGPVRVVDDLSLSVAAGELVALMGPSGSGKTSVVHLACGLLGPLTGTVSLTGTPMAAGDRRGWARARRRTVGVVHQRLDLLPGLSVLDNVALPLLLDRTPVGRAQARARDALARVGALDLAPAVPAELSGGEQQRVAIARATAGPRRLVLADEATAALDTASAEMVVDLLSGLAAEGAAVVMATHDTRLASWADRIVYLCDGREAPDPRAAALPRSL